MSSSAQVHTLATPRADAAFALIGVCGRRLTFGVRIAGTFRARLLGWLGSRSAPRGSGLWIVPCDGVHTFAMRFPIDLVFVDAQGFIRRIDPAVAPWRVRICIGAHSVIELEAGHAKALRLNRGDRLETRSV